MIRWLVAIVVVAAGAVSMAGKQGNFLSSVADHNEPGLAFLKVRGFMLMETNYHMQRVPEAYPELKIEGFRFDIYRGGDETTNAQIADQNRRLYAHDAVAYFTAPEEVERVFTVEGRFMIVARESESGDVAGFVDITKEAFVCNLGVARKHWGSGVALELSRRTITAGHNLGVDQIRSFVRSTNAASLRMQKRVGMEVEGTAYQYKRPYPDA